MYLNVNCIMKHFSSSFFPNLSSYFECAAQHYFYYLVINPCTLLAGAFQPFRKEKPVGPDRPAVEAELSLAPLPALIARSRRTIETMESMLCVLLQPKEGTLLLLLLSSLPGVIRRSQSASSGCRRLLQLTSDMQRLIGTSSLLYL